jgi:hypothetical protein
MNKTVFCEASLLDEWAPAYSLEEVFHRSGGGKERIIQKLRKSCRKRQRKERIFIDVACLF